MTTNVLRKMILAALTLQLMACGKNPADRSADPLASHPDLKAYQTPEQLAQINRLEKRVYALINENPTLTGRIFNFSPDETSEYQGSLDLGQGAIEGFELTAQGLPDWATWEQTNSGSSTLPQWRLTGKPPEDLLNEDQDHMVHFIEVLIKENATEDSPQILTLPLIVQKNSDRPRIERMSPFPITLKENEHFNFVVEVKDPMEKSSQVPPSVYFYAGETGFGADQATFTNPNQITPRRMRNGHWEYSFILDGQTLGALAREENLEGQTIVVELRLQARSSNSDFVSLPLETVFNFEFSPENKDLTGDQ